MLATDTGRRSDIDGYRAAMPTEHAYAAPDPPGSRGHLLDLYAPDEGADGSARPLVVWSSGSAFLSDDGKAGADAMAERFAEAGWVVAGVSVRSSGQAVFPAQVHDVKAAIRWLRAHATEHAIDPERLAIIGNSSGGWVASMAALTAGHDELEGLVGGHLTESSSVKAAVDLYGPTDFLQMDAHMSPASIDEFNAMVQTTDGHNDAASPESRLLGAPITTVPAACAAANPAAYASSSAPAMLIVHGQADQLVPHHQSELLYEALAAAGADVTFVSIPGNRHEHPYLADASHSYGRTVHTTRAADDPDIVALRDTGPTWVVVEGFLRRALD